MSWRYICRYALLTYLSRIGIVLETEVPHEQC
jgi:hypothetical protein